MTAYRYLLISLVCGLFFTVSLANAEEDGSKSIAPSPGSSIIWTDMPSDTSEYPSRKPLPPKKQPRKSSIARYNPPVVPRHSEPVSQNDISYWVSLTKSTGEKQMIYDVDGYQFQSGDQVVVHYRTAQDGSVAISNLGTSGAMQQIDNKKVLANQENHTDTFEFDKRRGEENLVLAFYPEKTYTASCSNGGKDLQRVTGSCNDEQENEGGKDLQRVTSPVNENNDTSPITVKVTLVHR